MGIRQEIERRRQEKQAVLNGEMERKRRLIEKISELGRNHQEIAQKYALPFVQKLEQSGVVAVLEDLRESMDLRYRLPVRNYGVGGKLKHKENVDSDPAALIVISEVEIGEEQFSFFGFNLEFNSGPTTPREGHFFDERQRLREPQRYLDELQRVYEEMSGRGIDDAQMKKCYAELVWNLEAGDGSLSTSGGCQYERCRFSLTRSEQGIYVLELTGGESFSESSWDRGQFEQAVAKVYVEGLTHVVEPGKADLY